jgi:hypothetical protein
LWIKWRALARFLTKLKKERKPTDMTDKMGIKEGLDRRCHVKAQATISDLKSSWNFYTLLVSRLTAWTK